MVNAPALCICIWFINVKLRCSSLDPELLVLGFGRQRADRLAKLAWSSIPRTPPLIFFFSFFGESKCLYFFAGERRIDLQELMLRSTKLGEVCVVGFQQLHCIFLCFVTREEFNEVLLTIHIMKNTMTYLITNPEIFSPIFTWLSRGILQVLE